MLNMTVRFTGCGDSSQVPETLDVSLVGGTQRVAISTMPFTFGHGETVRERNHRLRMSTDEIGRAVAQQLRAKLREMGHAV